MRLYQSNSFTEPITLYPHEVDLHSNLHVELVVESVDEELRIFTESLTASRSLEDTNKKYNVIQYGCHQDFTLEDHPVTDRRRQRLSFHVVKFDDFHEVYLTANVIICHNSTSPNRCTQGCITPRLRRDVRTSREELDSARLSEGPIVFKSDISPKSEKCFLKPGQIQRTFVTAFMENININSGTSFQLYLVTCDKAATVTVTMSEPFLNKTVHVDQDSSSLVILDYKYMITGQGITSKVIMVTSDVAISVFAFNTHSVTSDAMTCLPQEDLGVEYYIITPGQGEQEQSSKRGQFVVANGFEHEVQVDITVSGSFTYNGISYNTGDFFTLSLGNQQVIQFQSTGDLTGTKVSSSAPLAVFSGHTCYQGSNSACDNLMEQLRPVRNWGNVFAVFPFFTHTQDVITIIGGSPDTHVNIDSPGGVTNHSLQEGAYVRIPIDKILLIKATKPVMVSYLFHETRSGGLQYTYDPFLTTVPPSLLGRRYYKFVTQSLYDNFILIVSQVSSDSEFYLNGEPLSSYPTTSKEFNGFIGRQVTLGKTEGQHEIYHETSTFTLYIFGTGSYVSYGYSMGEDEPYSESSQEPESLIRCLPDAAEYILPYSLVTEAHLDVLDIHLKDPLCRAEEEKDHYLIKIPFNRCGSSVLNEDDKTFYLNTIYGTVPDTSVHRIEIPVKCEMQANETLDFSFQPKVNDVVSFGHYNVSLRLYQADNFTDLIAMYPHEVDIHGSLHVEFKVESEDEHLQILVEKCKASPSLGESEQMYNLIQHGCSQDSTLQTHLVLDQRLQRFSVHVFKFDNFQEVYLSCNVIICHNETVPNRCTQGCLTPRHRRDTRSSKVQLQSAKLSQGPIRISSDQPQNPRTVPVSALVMVIGVFGLLSVLGLVLQKHHYRRRDYTLLQNMATDN
ncbi:uncharacterized protein ACNLHF_027043 [Anomaloglossus baeobatrachus]